MAYELIKPKKVTLEKLVSSFQKALIHIHAINRKNQFLIIGLNDNKIIVQILSEKNFYPFSSLTASKSKISINLWKTLFSRKLIKYNENF